MLVRQSHFVDPVGVDNKNPQAEIRFPRFPDGDLFRSRLGYINIGLILDLAKNTINLFGIAVINGGLIVVVNFDCRD